MPLGGAQAMGRDKLKAKGESVPVGDDREVAKHVTNHGKPPTLPGAYRREAQLARHDRRSRCQNLSVAPRRHGYCGIVHRG